MFLVDLSLGVDLKFSVLIEDIGVIFSLRSFFVVVPFKVLSFDAIEILRESVAVLVVGDIVKVILENFEGSVFEL